MNRRDEVKYRPGLPTVEQIRAHGARTAEWCREQGTAPLKGRWQCRQIADEIARFYPVTVLPLDVWIEN